MKICFLCHVGWPNDDPPSYGGVQFATMYLARELIKVGCEVHVVVRSSRSRCNVDKDGIIVHYVSYASSYYLGKSKGKYTYLMQQLTYPISSLIVFNIINKINPDIVQCQHTDNLLAAYLAYKILKIPYILSLHGAIYKDLLFPLPFFLKKYWKKFPIISHASETLCLTEDAQDMAKSLIGGKSTVIPNGVNRSLFSPADTSNIRKNIELICVSRLVTSKGLEDAICSMEFIIKKYPNAILRFVGAGPLYGSLVNLVNSLHLEENIIFSGACKQEEVASYYNNARIFILPSLSEGFPLTVLEACSCGLPIILTPFHGAEEFIAQNNCGILVPFSSPINIADSVIQILENPSLEKTFSCNSLLIAEERSWSQISKHYLNCYSRWCQ